MRATRLRMSHFGVGVAADFLLGTRHGPFTRQADAYRVYYRKWPKAQGGVTDYDIEHSAAM